MPVKTEKELGEALRSQWLKAVAAIELRNFEYAISLLQAVLKQEPEFLTGRQLLRRAEVTKQKSAKKALFKVSTAALSIMKAQRELKKDPKRSVEMIEKVLENEPYNRQANRMLKEAAVAAGWPEIGVFALETLLEDKPRDPKILHELGRLHLDLDQTQHAVEVYDKLSRIDPTDAKALRLGKEAAARASMVTGGWARAESYRDLIRDKDAAIALETQIEETYLRHQAEPQNVDLARRLGVLYEQNQDTENAIAWFQYAADLSKNTDPSLMRKVSDLQRIRADAEIAAHENFLASHPPEEPEYAARADALAVAKKRQADFSIDAARKQSERNPTDLELRFQLGERFLEAGRPREALPELQRARQNPNVRLKAMNLLGRCYRELGMLDLAAKQLEEAAKEITAMDAMKKEIVYNLGLVYEEMGDAGKSIAALKLIYEADYGYRDVAARVERSYGAG